MPFINPSEVNIELLLSFFGVFITVLLLDKPPSIEKFRQYIKIAVYISFVRLIFTIAFVYAADKFLLFFLWALLQPFLTNPTYSFIKPFIITSLFILSSYLYKLVVSKIEEETFFAKFFSSGKATSFVYRNEKEKEIALYMKSIIIQPILITIIFFNLSILITVFIFIAAYVNRDIVALINKSI